MLNISYNGQQMTVEQWKAEHARVFNETGFPPELGYPLDAREQYAVAMKVDCPFCTSKVGERCANSPLFPQYPHTLRIEVAWLSQSTDTRKETST